MEFHSPGGGRETQEGTEMGESRQISVCHGFPPSLPPVAWQSQGDDKAHFFF